MVNNDKHKYFYADDVFDKQNNELLNVDKIVCDDSLQYLKTLPNNCIDCIITSPPYNFGLDYDKYSDQNSWQLYFDKLFDILKECIRVLKYSGRLIINVQPSFSDYVPTHHIISNFLMQQNLIWKGEIIWDKNNYNCGYCSWGSWKSPSSPYLKYTWEYIEVFCKGDIKKIGDSDKIDISADEFKDWVVAKWNIAPEIGMKKYDHPAMYPEQLVERLVKLFTFQGDLILDPFNGAGTTAYVAKKFGRKYIGIDISDEYCRVAQQRIDSVMEKNNLWK